MKSKDALGDRMKEYEGKEAKRKLDASLPIVARLDGKCFSKFTKGLKRPYDERMTDLMIVTAAELAHEYNALLTFVQSDEISMIFHKKDDNSQVIYDGRIQKIVGDMTAVASLIFNYFLADYIPEKVNEHPRLFPRFDCRVWNVPTKMEAVNSILWRQQDAIKNSVSMAAQHYFSHKELQGLHVGEMKEKLWQKKGILWDDYPEPFKIGTLIRREKMLTKFTTNEINNLPKNHEARKNPDLLIERNVFRTLRGFPLLKDIENKVEFVYEQQKYILRKYEL